MAQLRCDQRKGKQFLRSRSIDDTTGNELKVDRSAKIRWRIVVGWGRWRFRLRNWRWLYLVSCTTHIFIYGVSKVCLHTSFNETLNLAWGEDENCLRYIAGGRGVLVTCLNWRPSRFNSRHYFSSCWRIWDIGNQLLLLLPLSLIFTYRLAVVMWSSMLKMSRSWGSVPPYLSASESCLALRTKAPKRNQEPKSAW